MSGLLGGVLPAIYSQADRAKRYLGGLLSDPVGRMQQAGGQAVDDLTKIGLLGEQAFNDPRNPMKLQNNAAARQLVDTYLNSVMNFAPVGMTVKGPQAEALETARKNAVKMLGLPENNTPMDRARALGFVDDAYHGTSKEFQAFDTNAGLGKTSGTGAFFSNNPGVASTYASPEGGMVMPTLLRVDSPVMVEANGQNWNYLKSNTKVKAPKITVADKEGDQLMSDLFGISDPTMVNKKAFSKTVSKLFPDSFKYEDAVTTDDLARWANKEGYGAMVFNQIRDRGPTGRFATDASALPSTNTVIFNPANVRSRFAAFDPARINENDLLGRADPRLLALIGLGAGGAAYYGSDK